MKKFTMLFALLIIPFVFIACSDDDPVKPKPDGKNYMPMAVGYDWTYDLFELNMQNEIIAESKETDYMKVESQSTYMDKDAYSVARYINDELMKNFHFYSEDNKVYVESDFLLPLNNTMGLPFDNITNRWVVLADFSGANNWDLFTHQFANESITLPEMPVSVNLNASYTVKGIKKAQTVAITVGDQTVNAIEFEINHTLKGNLSQFIINIPVEFTITSRFYFAEDIGIVRELTESKAITINLSSLNMGTNTINVQGFQKDLKNYTIGAR